MAQVAVGGPLRVSDLTDEFGTHPDGVAGVGAGEWGRDRVGFLPEGRKTRREVVEHAFGEAGADAADMLQVAVLIGDGEDQRADPVGAAALAGAPPGDDDLLHSLVLDLAPVRGPLPRPVGRGPAF